MATMERERAKPKLKKKKIKSDSHVIKEDGDVLPDATSLINASSNSIEPETVIKNNTLNEDANENNDPEPVTKITNEIINLPLEINKPIEASLPIVKTVENIESKPSAPTYKELSAMVNKLKVASEYETPKTIQKVKPFTFEEIEKVFGIKEMVAGRKFASEFEQHNLHAPVVTHPLYEALMEYQRIRSQLILNQKDILTLRKECGDVEDVWSVKKCRKTASEKCEDGFYLSNHYDYLDAKFQDKRFCELQKTLRKLRTNITENFTMLSHSEHLIKLQIEDLILMSLNSRDSMIDSLKILFWVIQTSGWGFDKQLRLQLRIWCCVLAKKFTQSDSTLQATLFILHHLLKIPQGIRWGLHLIQCNIKSINDIDRALCLLEVILANTKDIQIQESKSNSISNVETDISCDIDDAELVVASEATDDNLWLLVDSDGESADIEAIGHQNKNILRETDILGLLRQIPFEEIFKQIMGITDNKKFDIRHLTGGLVLKSFAFARLFLKTIRFGLLQYKKYQELTKELCRLALHSIMYCTDLWEVMSGDCESNLIERLSTEYNNVFMAGISTLESAGSREISTMFISEMPFRLCWDRVIRDYYEKISSTLIISDSTWCHYSLITICNIAKARTEEDIVSVTIHNLFSIGFLSDFSELTCGEWARTLCGTALISAPHLIGSMLNNLTPQIDNKWLESLPLSHWRLQSDELLYHLSKWRQMNMSFIPYVLKLLNWEPERGIDFHTQRSVAVFLSALAQQHSTPKSQPPEWIWECLLLLRLHYHHWNLNPAMCPHPEAIEGIDISGKCLFTNTTLILMTSWGHSMPLIYQEAAPILTKLAISGRFREVIYIMYNLVPILSESPALIAQSKVFIELLSVILKNEKSYKKMASRLVYKDFPGPNIKLLVNMIRNQLNCFARFSLTSPSPLVAVWIHWLTSLDNWQNDWIAIYLLDVVIEISFFHYDAMFEASELCKKLLQSPVSPKSSSTMSWLWNNSSSHKTLIQCSVEAPFAWYFTLWVEHNTNERDTGVWRKIVEKLAILKEKTKSSVDKALKSSGYDISTLCIYKSLQYAISTPESHPILPLLWQQFFYLYLDISFLSNLYQPRPVGSLFFQDPINSKLLSKARSRLLELKMYYENKSTTNMEEENHPLNEQYKLYHTNQAELMNTFYLWLADGFVYDANNPIIYCHPYSEKLNKLVAGENVAWMETVNIFEYNKNQVAVWPPLNSTDSFKSFQKTENQFSPNDRILQRIQTYEKPIVTSTDKFDEVEIKLLVDPKIVNNFSEVFKLMENQLQTLLACARKYTNLCCNIKSVDDYLFKYLPELYERRAFLKNITMSCGTSCQRSVILVLKGEESILVDHMKSSILGNRVNQQKIVECALEPYHTVAITTAIIMKLSQLTVARPSMTNEGVKLFTKVLNAITEEIIDFPPANSVLNTVATELGETFIRVSGRQCINLINQVAKLHNEAFVCSLLRPLELSNNEMLEVYQAVSTTITESHIAFSCLSKFSISTWLRVYKPNLADRTKFINILCNAIAFGGCEPPSERSVIQELLCVHLDHMLAYDFPVHFNQILSMFYNLTIEKELPPNCWEHCFAVIEKYPDLITHQQICSNMESFGRLWWSKREMRSFHGLYDRYNIYIPAMARYGALFSSIVLHTAMIHQPLLLTHQICSVVFNMMCSFWNVWQIPRWDANNALTATDFTRGLSFMPWGVEDTTTSEIMLNAFVETITYCINTLPGSSNDFLRLSWQWYVCNYAHASVPNFILNGIHKALTKLPWTVSSDHWITISDLQSMSKLNSMALPLCHEFLQVCIGNRKWQNWINELPNPLQTNALFSLFPLLCRIQPDDHVLSDATLLSWELLKTKQYEELLNWFIVSYHSPVDHFFTNKMFPILCAAGGLKPNTPINSEWQAKQLYLIRQWVSTLSFLADPKVLADIKDLSKDIGNSTIDMLKKIELTALSAVATTEQQKLSECVTLLNGAVMMLNLPTLQYITQPKWLSWITSASKLCVDAMVGCVLNITQKSVFASVAEQSIIAYFKNGGDWKYLMKQWKNNCIIPVPYLIENNTLLTALITYLSHETQANNYEFLNKHVIRVFHNFKPTCTYEKEVILWIIYLIYVIRNYSQEDLKPIIPQLVTIFEKWSEKPNILQALINQSSPTDKFRIVVKFANCFILCVQGEKQMSNSTICNDNKKSIAILNTMLEQKSNCEIKHILVDYKNFLHNNENSLYNIVQKIIELSTILYADANYLNKITDLLLK